MENGEEGIFVYATRNPTGEVLSVLLEFHVAVAIACIRMNYRKVFWLVVAWRRGGDTFGHGGGRQSSTRGRRVGFVAGTPGGGSIHDKIRLSSRGKQSRHQAPESDDLRG